MIKERYQNPVIGDTVRLHLFAYNSNNFANFASLDRIEIYYLDPTAKTASNPTGETLIETINPASIVNPQTGEYYIDLYLDPALYKENGRYKDLWFVTPQIGDPVTFYDNLFIVYPELFYTTPIPVVYDFSFFFSPNKMRCGSKMPICIEVIPNVPRASDLEAYYTNLAIAAQLEVNIGEHCSPCTPCGDENLIVEDAAVQFIERNRAFFTINTNDFDCNRLYDIWFKLEFGGNTYVSPKSQLLIYS